jgi:phenylalanyl-tRNA synthetase alpha chain
MIHKIENLLTEIKNAEILTTEKLEVFRLKYLSKKGLLNQLFEEFKLLPNDQKRGVGAKLNDVKNLIQEKFNQVKEQLEEKQGTQIQLDMSLPGDSMQLGSRHPISLIKNEINQIFIKLGFTIAEGPEIEDDWHNFSALNFADGHPAREMQDTFFIEKDPDILLRTHTSSVQVRKMETTKPPIRSIMPGRVYRNEAISARSHCFFHQIEGLFIDKNVSFVDLKQTLLFFAKELFGTETEIRLRPSYFPFTEPSAEMDVSCNCKGKGCNLCKNTGWLEVLGCGMVDPAVLDLCGIDSKVYSGYAFGLGIERIALLKYNIKDIRMYSENDMRFTKQFSSSL